MSGQMVITIAVKDLRILAGRRVLRAALVLFPLLLAIGFPALIKYAGGGQLAHSAAGLPQILGAFSFFFVIIAAQLPTVIAAYSLVGEKVERSLEPLLATPASDGEILLGKGIAAVVPPVAAIWLASVVFMALMDAVTRQALGRLFYPDATGLLILAVLVPLTAILSVEFSVLVSARVGDIRTAQQSGVLIVLPMTAIYVLSEINVFRIDNGSLGVLAGVLAALDVVLAILARATFQREEILTRWA